jgi:hypothetical protein
MKNSVTLENFLLQNDEHDSMIDKLDWHPPQATAAITVIFFLILKHHFF